MRAPISWQKSSFSEREGSCVEIARHENDILLRESDDPEVAIRTTSGRLQGLITGVKAGVLIA
jgi:Domain of unknown function (DUF397)